MHEQVMASDILVGQRSEWDAGARFDFENPEYR